MGLKILLPVLVLALAGFGMQKLIDNKKPPRKRPAREQVFVVNVQPVELQGHRVTFQAYGEAQAARRVDLRALVGGKIIAVAPDLKAGQRVSANTPLVTIDPFVYEGLVREARAKLAEGKARVTESQAKIASEKGALERAKEQLAFARNDLERVTRLKARGAATQKNVEDRKLIVSQRQQSLELRENNLTVENARLNQRRIALQPMEWQLTRAERNLRDTVLKAPFDAIVQSENVEPGRLINVNDGLATLYDAKAVDIRFTLTDSQYGTLVANNVSLVGHEANVSWQLGDLKRAYKAKIERVGAELAARRGGVDVYARISGEQITGELRPGAFVTVSVPAHRFENIIKVSEAALYQGDVVYVVKEGRMKARKVKVKAREGRTLILSGDFKPGESLILTRISVAGEGLKVRTATEARKKPASRGKPEAGQPTGKPKARPDRQGAMKTSRAGDPS